MKRPRVGAFFQRVTCTSFCVICCREIRDGIMTAPTIAFICDECARALGEMADDAKAESREVGP